jgi:hypothetical protein
MSFDHPAPDIAKLQVAWEKWERGEEAPGRVLADLKISGMRELLETLVESGWQSTR